MLKKLAVIFLLFIVIILLTAFANAVTEVLDSERAVLEISERGRFSVIPLSSHSSASEVEASLKWFPRDSYNQDVESLSGNPVPEKSDENIIFKWLEPDFYDKNLVLEAVVTTRTDILPVNKRIKFPIRNLDPELSDYVMPTSLIVIDDNIKSLANRLSSGKNDLYEVVFSLADWVTTHITYNLSSITANAVYPSDWVLRNRYGVCDEMTNLFISLNRALGIPARFASGLAYTNMPGVPEWGGHGWAEVYFPGFGWVPFDPTYGEYGYLDAGHIKLNDGLDSTESSIVVTAKGVDIDINTKPLDFDVKVTGRRSRNYDIIETSLEPYYKEVGFGSYDLLVLNVKNLMDYYVSTRVELSHIDGSTHESPDNINILLKPLENKKVYFLVRFDNLDENYDYTFPFGAYTKLAPPATTNVTVNNGGIVLKKNLFISYFGSKPLKDLKIYTDCEYPENITIGLFNISCRFINKGSGNIVGLACIDDYCKNILLDSGSDGLLSAELRAEDPGIFTVPVTFRSRKGLMTSFEKVRVFDDVNISINNLRYSKTLGFYDGGRISFVISRSSFSAPVNGSVSVINRKFSYSWGLHPKKRNEEFILDFKGSNLSPGPNTIKVVVDYYDQFGGHHRLEKSFIITLAKLTLWQRIVLFFDDFGRLINDYLPDSDLSE